jgi:hypothetical protein
MPKLYPSLTVIFLVSFFSFAGLAYGTEEEDCQLALLEDLSGSITLAAQGGKAEARAGDSLALGDRLETGADSWADLRLCDGSGLRVGENSRFELEAADQISSIWSWAFALSRGLLRASVKSEESGGQVKLRVRTPVAALGVRGTEFVVETGEESGTSLHTLDGEVLMGSAKDWEKFRELHDPKVLERFEPVRKEQTTSLRKGELRPRRASRFQVQNFLKERGRLFQRPLPKWNREQFRKLRQEIHGRRQAEGKRALEQGRRKMDGPHREAGRAAHAWEKKRIFPRERQGVPLRPQMPGGPHAPGRGQGHGPMHRGR